MTKKKITPVLLCGGSGTRLWPLSRESFPKQFVALRSRLSLFQETVQRIESVDFTAPVVITSERFRFVVAEQLEAISIKPKAIILEPEVKNTAPAILAALTWLENAEPEGTVVVLPTDHGIENTADFQDQLARAANCASEGRLVTLGITPTHPSTSYGYIKPDGEIHLDGTAVAQFVEKPNLETAERLIKNPDMMWNAGIFIFDRATAKIAFENHAPDLLGPVTKAVSAAIPDFGFLRLDADAWSQLSSISFDHAIMERAANISVVPYHSGWSDLGNWDSILTDSAQDESGSSFGNLVTTIDCEGSLLRNDPAVALTAIGIKDMVIIAEPDAVLVADRHRSNDIGDAVKIMRQKGLSQADQSRRDHRPWGWCESLSMGDQFQVKQIYVKPGGTLSLQSHKYRAEHWIVVEGTAEVTIDGVVSQIEQNQSVYVPLGAIHRLKNPTNTGMRLIEIQTGTYFGEDDIKRYEDIYARND